MKNLSHIILILILLTFAVQAQEWNILATQLQRMEIQILRVQALAERYQNARARELVTRAQNAFIASKDLAARYRFIEARAKFLEARELLEQSTRLLLLKPASTLKLELDKLIHEAEQASYENPGVEGQYLLNRARTFQTKAVESFNQADYLNSERYLRIARFFARKSLQISGVGNNAADWLEEFLETYNEQDNLYQELQNTVDPNSEAADVLTKTGIYLRQANNEYNKKNQKEAFANLQIAERFLLRVIDLSRDDTDDENPQVHDGLISIRRFLDGVELDLHEKENKSAHNLLQKANQFYRGAVLDAENGRIQAARNKIRLAQRMGSRALRLSDSDSEFLQDRIPGRIAELNRLLELQKSKIDELSGTMLHSLQQQAVKFLDNAQSEYDTGNKIKAYALLDLALRIINRIEYLIKFKANELVSKENFDEEYTRISNNLSLLSQNQRMSDPDRARAEVLLTLLSEVKNVSDGQDLGYASELLYIVQNQLTELLNRSRY